MGLAYFRIPTETLDTLSDQIAQHESDLTGPRSRGYWFEQPDSYDYEGARSVARSLYAAGEMYGLERLELSENEAHSLSLLELELPADGQPLPPSLFLISADADTIKSQLKFARRKLGPTPDIALTRIDAPDRDPRFAGYLRKQVRHLHDALPKVWQFYARAAEADQAIVVIDLRARDLEIPEPVELTAF
ncbi:MAG: hypothetical protein ACYDBJ_12790 [Aggregatilineales bacterium]